MTKDIDMLKSMKEAYEKINFHKVKESQKFSRLYEEIINHTLSIFLFDMLDKNGEAIPTLVYSNQYWKLLLPNYFTDQDIMNFGDQLRNSINSKSDPPECNVLILDDFNYLDELAKKFSMKLEGTK